MTTEPLLVGRRRNGHSRRDHLFGRLRLGEVARELVRACRVIRYRRQFGREAVELSREKRVGTRGLCCPRLKGVGLRAQNGRARLDHERETPEVEPFTLRRELRQPTRGGIEL